VKNGIFIPALERLRAEGKGWLEPEPFQDYAAMHELAVRGTAPYISVQSFSHLAGELVDERVMVFRLGASTRSRHTDFALVRVVEDWKDYFLFDEEIFADLEPEKIEVDWRSPRLFPFLTIPKLTETSHVNLALASGVFEKALNIDPGGISIPATGKGCYDFIVRPHARLDAEWNHRAGQVEIDSVFTTSASGRKTLFVIEAKSGRKLSSLPKYKLVYPLLAVADRIPEDFEIVPVYLRIIETPACFRFHVAVCRIPDPRRNSACINQLEVKQARIIELSKAGAD